MRKITLTMALSLLALTGVTYAQSSCTDLNGYVESKNTGGTGYYTLINGFEEEASQTYHYAGPGKVTSVRVYGNYPGIMGGVPLRVGIYDVDANGRPTNLLQSTNDTWWWFDNFTGYITVNFGGGGVHVDNNFAVAVEIRNASPWGNTFQLKYTGDSEGLGQDLASLAGTSTGSNWTSAMTNFNKDGDFYLVPRMTHYIEPIIGISSPCIGVNAPVAFNNLSEVTTDSMFNTIGLAAYSGTGNFYSWDFGDGSPVSNVASPSHAYATAGSYTVTLTCMIDGWNNDCSSTTSVVVSVGLGVSATAVDATCFGSADGSITATGSAGTAPYQYSIDGGNTYQSSATFSGLDAGTYTVNVMDALGCTSTTVAIVTEPSEISITGIYPTFSSCGSSNGALLITATGGTGTLQYQLNAGGYQSSGSFTNLASGFYAIDVQDANGCVTSTFGSVSDQGGPVLSIVSQTNASCNNSNDGTIILIGTGGSGVLQYSINGGNTWQTSGSFTGLAGGMYLAMVKDAAGCSDGERIDLNLPPVITVAAVAGNVDCNGGNNGSITVSQVTGGTGTFVYSLDNISYQSGTQFTGLTAGTYTVYAKDVAGCIATTSVTVTEPAAIVATASAISASCNGSYTGGITVNATGGTGTLYYSLDGENYSPSNLFDELNAGTYTITIQDENGCMEEITAQVTEPTAVTAVITTGASTCGNANGTLLAVGSGGSGSGYTYSIDGVNYSAGGSFSGLVSGNYNIIVMDGTGCSEVFVAAINDANGPSITSMSSTNVACNEGNDGTITINSVTGGTGTLEYSVNGSQWQTSSNFTALTAGTYTVLVQDANGCVGQSTVTLTQPNPIIVTTSVVNLDCHGDNSGVVTVNAAGGAGTLAYSIDNEWPYQSSGVFTGLGAGNYLAVVRDAAGCLGMETFEVTEPADILIHTSVLNVMCTGAATGAIYANATGGTGLLLYSLDGITYQTGTAFTNLTAGVYTVYVQDANGCVRQQSVTVAEPAPLIVLSNVIDVVCSGGNDGVIDLTVTGGAFPYTFDWSNDFITEDIFNLTAGTYSVIVTDMNGCSSTQTFVINQPSNPLIVNGSVIDATGQTATDGSVDIVITGGAAPYTFLWSNGAITEDITGVAPGVYTVIITDANGCVTSGTYTVSFNIGITDHTSGASINVYPNPANENFTIDAGTTSIDRIEIIDVLGQVVFTAEPNTSKTQVNTVNYAEGVYFVRTYTVNGVSTKRIEIAK